MGDIPLEAVSLKMSEAVDEELDRFLHPDPEDDEVWESIPPDPQEFIESKEYLGLKGRVFKRLIEIMVLLEDPKVRVANLLLGKGSGKSTLMQIFSLKGVDQVVRMRNPSEFFGLIPGDEITILNVSVSERHAHDKVFAGIEARIKESPFFRKIAVIGGSQIEFPKNIHLYSGHSNATAWLGFNTLRGGMDEVEYMLDTNRRSVAKRLAEALLGSMKTRYPNHYKILRVSSVWQKNSYLYRQHERVVRAEATGVELPIPDDETESTI